MSILLRYSLLLTIFVAVKASVVNPRTAIAILTSRNSQSNQNIVGSIVFTETDNGLRLTGTITGLRPGLYGFHVHAGGDITTCDSAGPHFNPGGNNHGGRDHAVRHVGDLGNVEFYYNANNVVSASIDATDRILTLRGRNNILGRTIVLHEREDDLGLGGHELSLTTGNAGPRAACGVIGLVSPVQPWENSAVTTSPSLLLYVVVALFAYFRV